MDKKLQDTVVSYCSKAETPSYIVDERLIKHNLEILKGVIERTGAHILLAQKAFSMYSIYPFIGKYLSGTTASGLYEAKLGFEEMQGKEVHIYSPAYKEKEFDEILSVSDHIVFNSIKQWRKYKDKVFAYNQSIRNEQDHDKRQESNNASFVFSEKIISCGLRINPEYAEIETDIYNPCIVGSRLGTTMAHITEEELEGIEGLHFHTMCEQNSDVLYRTIQVVDEKFGAYLKNMKWINFGGGHHITREDYDIETLEACIRFFQEKYDLEVYIEPGEAVALNAGFLVTEVLEIVQNGMDIAILDVSAACHMPDVIEMPYRPSIIGAKEANEAAYTYRLGGPTCLAGDVIGDYSFEQLLKAGDKLIFCDMAIYSMVKNNTFNGMPLPNIYLAGQNNELKLVKRFSYEDFKMRLS